ncbi:MAG: Y-family DNA polymerase [Bacteroidota bacterium]
MFAIVDCNNFYASCERLFKPKLRNKPIVVLSNNDGCVIARSNEAKAIGIKMGEPAFKIEPFLANNDVAVFSSNYALYGDISERVMNTISSVFPEIEVYSIDEVFIDLSSYSMFDLSKLCLELRAKVFQWTGIPVSIGIAPTKTLAKVANRIAKKEFSYNGVFFMDDEAKRIIALKQFPVEDVWGIGRKYAIKLQQLNVKNAYDFCKFNENWIRKNMTVMGVRTQKELQGISCIPLEKGISAKKSICTARSFGKNSSNKNIISQAVANYAARCAEKLRKQKGCATYICVFLETNRFRTNDPQYNAYKVIHLPLASNNTPDIIRFALIAFDLIFKPGFLYKKAGVIVSEIIHESQIQLSLFDNEKQEKVKSIMITMDRVNNLMGRDKIRIAKQGFDRKWKLRQEKLSPCYTSRWSDLLTINIGKQCELLKKSLH